ncbi:hypothetical protein HA402_007829 [Bradysia odoriphaga]|nr:hypothetical protein HA402_007829 [Bradysia odoriphaga]
MFLFILYSVSVIVAASATEYGTLEIRFDRAQGKIDIDGKNCDNCFLCYNKCDPYMKVKIDGVEKFRTSTAWDNESPTFNEVFTSERISKDANIAIEMWDDDAGDSEDDLMSRWERVKFDPSKTQDVLDDLQNSIRIFAQWK